MTKEENSKHYDLIEANEALSKKDFRMRVRISRKEAKESTYWLKLLDTDKDDRQERERQWSVGEATELMNIFGGILRESM